MKRRRSADAQTDAKAGVLMNQLDFRVGGYLMGAHDVALVDGDEDPRERLIEAVIGDISTDVEVTLGGVTMHLAAWMDPEHWSDDWAAAVGEDEVDVDALVANNLEEWKR